MGRMEVPPWNGQRQMSLGVQTWFRVAQPHTYSTVHVIEVCQRLFDDNVFITG